MAKADIARRVYNHAWKLDPIVRSLLDTDFYKLLMLQMIWKLYPDVDVTFTLINRTTKVRIADEIDEGELLARRHGGSDGGEINGMGAKRRGKGGEQAGNGEKRTRPWMVIMHFQHGDAWNVLRGHGDDEQWQ